MTSPAFASEFPAASHDDWMKAVDLVLKGKPFASLVGQTYDGIDIQPLYARDATAKPIAGRAGGAPWTIVQRVDMPDAAAANAQALEDLQNGASGLVLVEAGRDQAGFGIKAADLPAILKGVMLDLIPVRLEGAGLAEAFANYVRKAGFAPSSIQVAFGLDPVGDLACFGRGDLSAAAEQAKGLIEAGFKGTTMLADGALIHEAGGAEVEELAFTLASAVAYLRALEAAGVQLSTAAKSIGFLLAADADQYLGLAKFRAIRLLWNRVEEACGLAPSVAEIHAVSAWRMMSRTDPAVNWLRTTMACFAAGLGGADHISLRPWTAAIGLPDAFSRRVARNTQLTLMEESNLHRVADPAAGAGGIEALTRELCEKAWTRFQAIEAAGGVMQALASVEGEITRAKSAREKAIARRKEPLTGVSEFPNVSEKSPEVLVPAKPVNRHGFSPIRLAEPFESLRDKAHGKQVFLANLGPVAAFTARTTFAKNFFEAGGILAIGNDGFTDVEAMVKAFKASKAHIVCLCSSDEVYAEQAVAAAKALKTADAKQVWLAGRPGALEEALREAGCTHFAFAGADVLAALATAHTA